MDFTGIAGADLLLLGVLLVGLLVGRGLGMETRVLTGYLVVAVLSPAAFPSVALGYLVLCVAVKVGSQWVSWL